MQGGGKAILAASIPFAGLCHLNFAVLLRRPISEPPATLKLAHLPGFARLLLQLAPDRCKSAGGIEALGVGHETRISCKISSAEAGAVRRCEHR